MVEVEQEKQYWLVLSYASNIPGSACANHIDDRLPLFRKKNIEPLLLSGYLGDAIIGVKHFRTMPFGPSGWRAELRRFFRNKAKTNTWFWKPIKFMSMLFLLPFYVLEKIIVDLDNGWTWFPSAFVKGLWLARRYPVKRIYSTGGSVSAHLASGLLAKFSGIPWIAEFQDPLVYDQWLRSKRSLILYQFIERWICARANRVIFLTELARQTACSRTDLTTRSHVIYPGVLKAEVSSPEPQPNGKEFNISHFGSLGATRNLDGILSGLSLMIDRCPELKNLYRLHLYGNIDKKIRTAIAAFPDHDQIIYHGMVSRDDAKKGMSEAHMLLLIQNTHPLSSVTIPSKFYEYLYYGRIILGLTFKNSELDDMIQKAGHLFVPANDGVKISKTLEHNIKKWCSAPEQYKQTVHTQYSVEKAVTALVECIDDQGQPVHRDESPLYEQC